MYVFLSSHRWEAMLLLNCCLCLQERIQEEATGKTTRREEVSSSPFHHMYTLSSGLALFSALFLYSTAAAFDSASALDLLLLKRPQNQELNDGASANRLSQVFLIASDHL